MVDQIHKTVFTPVTHARGAVLSYLLPIFVYCFFWMFRYFLKTIQLLNIFLYNCSWYYSEGYLTKKTFLQHLLLCWEQFWGILGLILGYALLFLKAVPCLIIWNFVQMFFALDWKSMFRAFFVHISQCLENIKTFSWYPAWTSWYYCGGH